MVRPLTSCRSAIVRSGIRLYTWLLSAMGGSASSKRPRGNSFTSSVSAARADPGRRDRVTEAVNHVEGHRDSTVGSTVFSQ